MKGILTISAIVVVRIVTPDPHKLNENLLSQSGEFLLKW